MSEKNPQPIIEALLFATPEPLSAQKLASLVRGCDVRRIRDSVREIQKQYEESGRGFALVEVAGGYQVLSRQEYSEHIRDLHHSYAEAKLSQAALETLAVIAYKQPVLRAEIEAIRGVQAGPLLRSLMDRGLVKIVGRADTLGRPTLYGTTRRFLERFLLKSLKDLPQAEVMEAGEKDPAAPDSSERTRETAEAGSSVPESTPATQKEAVEAVRSPAGAAQT
ncbi:MAG: SMC-Scp complex subunit ScpB [Planctomycetes bacterium]|nr:SMC-Scp complex subunit ScpB [Planctomycetota bacterium]